MTLPVLVLTLLSMIVLYGIYRRYISGPRKRFPSSSKETNYTFKL